MRIVAFSDTHGYHHRLDIPGGDVLVYAGDFSMRAKLKHIVEFADWIKSLPHTHKIVIPGNHDCACETNIAFSEEEFAPVHFLVHRGVEIEGIKFFGSPYTSSIYEPSIWSFDYPRESNTGRRYWNSIPEDTQVLITHGPAKGIGDRVLHSHVGEDPHVGDPDLLAVINKIRPKVHIFGHIHEGYGKYYRLDNPHTHYYNVCVCTEDYKPANKVTVIDFELLD